MPHSVSRELKDLFIKLNLILFPSFKGNKIRKIIHINLFYVIIKKTGILSDPEKVREIFHGLIKNEAVFEIEKYIESFLSDEPLYTLGGIFHSALIGFDFYPEGIKENPLEIKNHGAFYTPLETARVFIEGFIRQLDKNGEKSNSGKILDLACGCGIFSSLLVLEAGKKNPLTCLVPLCPEITNYLLNEPGEDTLIKLAFIFNGLEAFEKDISAVWISRYSIIISALINQEKIISSESFLNLIKKMKNIKAFNIYSFYKNMKEEKSRYRGIVSNPPYISYYSRHSRQVAIEKDNPLNLKENLLFRIKGRKERINSIMFFVDFAIRKTVDGGILAFLTDFNIHEKLFENMRKWILENLGLLEIWGNISEFKGVNSGQVFLYLKNQYPNENYSVIHYDGQRKQKWSEDFKKHKNVNSFFLTQNPDWVDHLDSFSKLSEIAKINTGVNIGGSFEEFVFNKKENSFYPFITTRELRQKYISIDGKYQLYFDFNIEKAKEINKKNSMSLKNNIIVLGKKERFSGPKIFIRQSSPEIMAFYSDKPMICPYSVFVLNDFQGVSLYVYLAVLNSKLISEYSRKKGIIRMGVGKQPQIRKSGLDQIPFPPLNILKDKEEEIEKNIKSIFNLTDNDIRKSQIVDELEKTVISMYGLNPEEVD